MSGFFARPRPRGVSINATFGEKRAAAAAAGTSDRHATRRAREHLCAQRRCVSPKHVYSDLIYRSVGESGWLVYKEAEGGGSLVSRAGPGATSLRQMGPSCPL